ncbi:MAG: hypothetical protein P0Y60_03845 [Candidatus Microbacterium colombiense]|nr:MAG: hypothetical protein P0Y60_03845 [Microbacterium sp.]
MLKERTKRAIFSCVAGITALGLASCSPVPNLPVDQPLSLSVIQKTAQLTWCSSESTLTRVVVVAAAGESADDKIVIVREPGIEMSFGEYMTVLTIEDFDEAGKNVTPRNLERISVGVEYTDVDGSEGAFSVRFDFDDSHNFLRWIDGDWGWPTGEFSTQRCGMPSAR